MASLSSIVVPSSQWPATSSASACQSCGRSFGLFTQRDHCQCCGRVCCSSTCLENRVVLPNVAGDNAVPVCDQCASTIRRTRQDAEVAVERCHILEQLLNEQTLQSEKLMGQSKALRVENEFLLKDKERLAAQLKKAEIELEVAAAKAALKESVPSSASPTTSTPTAAPTGAVAGGADASSEQAAALEKKKKQLDMREATLQEALKKVSNDAAKLVSQRTALQERERQYKETLTKQFEHVFSEERAAWESLYTRQTDDLAAQFRDWLAAGQQCRPPHDTQRDDGGDARDTQKEAVDAAIAAAVEEARTQLHAQHAAEVADQNRELEDYRREVASLNERLMSVQTQPDDHAQAALREAEEARRDAEAQWSTARERWDADRLILENTIEALKRRLAEAEHAATLQASDALSAAQARIAALEQQVSALERTNGELADAAEQKMRRMMASVTDAHDATTREVAQLEAALEREKTRAAVELAEVRAAHTREVADLQRALDERAAADDASSTIKEWEERCEAQTQALEALRNAHAAEHEALVRQHQAALAEADRAAASRIAQLTDQLAAAQSALQQRTAELEEARAEAAQKASVAPPHLQVLFSTFLDDARLAQRVMLTEYAQSLLTAKESLTAMASRSLKMRQDEQTAAHASEQALKRRLASAKRESKEYEARAEEQAREALQNKRDAIAAKEELTLTKEKLRRLQQQQRNQMTNGGGTLSASSVGPSASQPVREEGQRSAPRGNSATRSVSADGGNAAYLRAVSRWGEERQQLLLTYVEAVQRGPLADVTHHYDERLTAMAEEVERRREQSRRNAMALERTTSTIKELQQDLRLRTDRVEEREAAMAQGEAALKAKRARVLALCRSLGTVTQTLRERQVALSREEATAAQEVQDLCASPASSEKASEH